MGVVEQALNASHTRVSWALKLAGVCLCIYFVWTFLPS